MAVEDGVEALLGDEPKRDVEPTDERDRQRHGRVERLLGDARALPVEIEAWRGTGRRERRFGDGGEPETRRTHERFLRTGDDDVQSPHVRLARNRAEARDRVDDDESADFLRRGGERTNVGHNAGRRLGMDEPDRLRLALAQPRAQVVGVGRLSPGVTEDVDFRAERGQHRLPPLPERAGRDDEMRFARRNEVRDRGFERAGARGAEQQDVVLRPAYVAQPGEDALVDRQEVGAAVMDDGSANRREYLRRDGRRSGREQVPLPHVPSVAL